jgi:hypothetical protein
MESKELSPGKLSIDELFSLEEYHNRRAEFRARVLDHKKRRQVAIGPIVTLYFEDRLTVQYQVQEMLRIERIFEREGIAEELAAYNPLIPDGTNLKATFMIEIPDEAERRRRLRALSGIEGCLYAFVANSSERVACIADEDIDRSSPEKTSAVHFVRFEFSDSQRHALQQGAGLSFGIDHPEYTEDYALSEVQRVALIADLR